MDNYQELVEQAQDEIPGRVLDNLRKYSDERRERIKNSQTMYTDTEQTPDLETETLTFAVKEEQFDEVYDLMVRDIIRNAQKKLFDMDNENKQLTGVTYWIDYEDDDVLIGATVNYMDTEDGE